MHVKPKVLNKSSYYNPTYIFLLASFSITLSAYF